jgi:hypothetical protein
MTNDDVRRGSGVREGYWFVPKGFGFGATPATWQGWAVTIGFAGALVLAVRLLPMVAEKIIVALVLIAAMVAITVAKTDGGWRWRWRSGSR